MSDSTNTIIRHLSQQFTQLGRLKKIYLRPVHGEHFMEVTESEAVTQAGFQHIETIKDLGGNDRVTIGQTSKH